MCIRDSIEPTIQALASCFEDLDSNTLYGYAKDQKDSRYIVLKKKASYEEIQPFVEMQEAVDEKGKKVNPDIKGVWFEKEYQREYPYGALGSSIVGFTASGNVGVNGLEPVSYTHLDVYKRQSLHRELMNCKNSRYLL